ncbi:MAG: carboxymuconolactone decarboxylase family protein [Rhodospirillaceae bacterium]
MARIDPPALDDLSSEQKALRDLIMKQRSTGEARGPFGILLHAPDLGSRVADFVNYLLSDTRLSHRLKELAIITVARRYTAQYEWWIHARRAERHGLEEEIIEAIFEGSKPTFADKEGDVVHEVASALASDGQMGDELYQKAEGLFGKAGMVELVTIIGLYMMIAVFLNAFQVDVPDPNAKLLKEI